MMDYADDVCSVGSFKAFTLDVWSRPCWKLFESELLPFLFNSWILKIFISEGDHRPLD